MSTQISLQTPRARRRIRNGETGSSLVEFAISLPVVATLLFAFFSFGILMQQYLALTNATNLGAQAIALARGQTTDPCQTGVNAFETAAPSFTTSSLSFSFAYNGGTAITSTTCATQALVEGQSVQLTVTYPCSIIFLAHNFSSGCTLTSTTTEAIE